MRAQLAVSSLIVFGVILIGLGFTGLPYVLTYDQTVAVQTSRVKTVEELELVITSLTMEETTIFPTVVSTTSLSTETFVTTSTVKQSLVDFSDRRIEAGIALVTGPFVVNGPSSLEVSWRSAAAVSVYLALNTYENISGWMLLGRGVTGSATMPLDRSSTFYLIVSSGPASSEVSLTAMAATVETITETTTLTTTTFRTTTITSTSYKTSEKTYTTTFTTTRPEYFVVTYVTSVTETRYPNLSFMIVMGSFLVFVGLLLMFLILRTLAKPVEKA
ncbi:MAG: hypothetical protein QW240_08610 [Candidatus Caldarchaeum sp.]